MRLNRGHKKSFREFFFLWNVFKIHFAWSNQFLNKARILEFASNKLDFRKRWLLIILQSVSSNVNLAERSVHKQVTFKFKCFRTFIQLNLVFFNNVFDNFLDIFKQRAYPKGCWNFCYFQAFNLSLNSKRKT